MTNKSPTRSWRKGQSGNPKGRPVGSGSLTKKRNENLSILMEHCKSHWQKIVKKIIQDALAGQHYAVKLIFDQVLPKQRFNEVEEEDLTDGLTEEDNEKVYQYLSSIIPQDQIASFVDNATKVTNFIKQIKLQRAA